MDTSPVRLANPHSWMQCERALAILTLAGQSCGDGRGSAKDGGLNPQSQVWKVVSLLVERGWGGFRDHDGRQPSSR